MRRPVSLEQRLRRLVVFCFVPLTVVIVLLLTLLLNYSMQYNTVLHNVTSASAFNQNFKESIDLEMYYYVVGSRYSTGLPIQEVQDAQQLARALMATTTDHDSRRAIESVLNLSENLEKKIYQIQDTDNYDDRQNQLENNIYVLTDLIQEYMYNYLYYEAVQLSTLQTNLYHSVLREVFFLGAAALMLLIYLTVHANRITHSITRPIGELSERVKAIGRGELESRPPVEAQETEVRALSEGFEKTVDQLRGLIEQSKQEQISLRNAELALLQAQINPHFLYNTLDTIIWLIETQQYEQAEQMVSNLSAFFRTSLSKGRDIIALAEEEKHVRSYMEIQQIRYRDILQYEVNIPPELTGCMLPKLTLQPLVENALYHGIKLKRGPGHIWVAARAEGDDVVLQVRDDGVGMPPERLEMVRAGLSSTAKIGFGLATVHERMQLLFGAPYGLTVDSTPGEGTLVTVRIPNTPEVKGILDQQEAIR
ncbi:MAG: sensor histidine kinase [Faecalibacterium sp.]|jgi:two-component system sensor histidine kinase YesM|nr:sensor histidine kinase [Faecalibacterium sp.]